MTRAPLKDFVATSGEGFAWAGCAGFTRDFQSLNLDISKCFFVKSSSFRTIASIAIESRVRCLAATRSARVGLGGTRAPGATMDFLADGLCIVGGATLWRRAAGFAAGAAFAGRLEAGGRGLGTNLGFGLSAGALGAMAIDGARFMVVVMPELVAPAASRL